MARHVWHAGEWVSVETLPKAEPRGPYLHSDYEAYRSPLGTGWIEGRAARREEMKRHDCVPYERQGSYKGGVSNPEFAAKRGLSVNAPAVPKLQRINEA